MLRRSSTMSPRLYSTRRMKPRERETLLRKQLIRLRSGLMILQTTRPPRPPHVMLMPTLKIAKTRLRHGRSRSNRSGL